MWKLSENRIHKSQNTRYLRRVETKKLHQKGEVILERTVGKYMEVMMTNTKEKILVAALRLFAVKGKLHDCKKKKLQS